MRASQQLSAVLGALGLAGAALCTPAQADPTLRSFTAKLNIIESVQLLGTLPCLAEGRIQGSGRATPLGAVTVESSDCINPLGLFDPSSPGTGAFLFVSKAPGMTFTAQNGDRLFVTYSGTLLPKRNGPHRISGSFVITGGTGSYAGAVGGGILFGTEDISQGTSGHGVLEAVGTIVH